MNAVIFLSRTFSFEAAHSLHMDDAENAGYKRIHGHSFTATLTVRGPKDEIEHWLMDFERFDPVIEKIKDKLDHGFLNELPGLKSSTMENICAYIYEHAKPDLPALYAVELQRKTCGQSCKLVVED
jgi:6-pyruvoyltetrahydropterin/6-carboxytetrahydropterin synthase